MKKFFSLIAVAVLVIVLPVFVWAVKPAQLDQVLVFNNSQDSNSQPSGVEYFFKNARANPTVTALQDVTYSIDEAKGFDAVYAANEDGKHTTLQQWNQVKMNIDQNRPSVLFAEYGLIHNAEDGDLAQVISEDLGVNSTNWAGLYVQDLALQNNPVIPQRVYNSVEGQWDYSGPGLVLHNNNEEKTIVVELNQGDVGNALALKATAFGESLGYEDLPTSYGGWFDVVEPNAGTEAIYDFSAELSEEGRALFREHGIPETLPAVTLSRSGPSYRFYLAGRFSAAETIPQIYSVWGISSWYAALGRYSSSSFYWNSFFPLVEQSLKNYEEFRSGEGALYADTAHAPTEEINYPSRISGEKDRIEVLIDGTFQPLTIKGVNIGMAKPGYFPGEAAVTLQEYRQWFEQIGQMNANTIRVYTLHPPEFYRALAQYNATHDKPLYVLHGVWINEDWITDDADAFHEQAVHGFQTEIQHVVDALHGNTVVDPVPGHSSGVYVADVSDYVIGWVIGTEWNPFMVLGTNAKHQDIGQFSGQFYETADASPFEHWLASQMEYTTKYEVERYKQTRPMSFTNWVTTDILRHPSDGSNQEDIAEVNPNHIHTKDIMNQVGQFASYHVYPYYPDFLQRDQKYLNVQDWRGETNPYYAYLQELRSVHDMPVLVAEFGIPSSRGRTHSGPNGMHQGMVSEQDQGRYMCRMYEDIMHANYMGGLVFTWQDEWFKRTWNTMDFDNPDRRPFWPNVQTSEQRFGMLGFDPDEILVDGDGSEWTAPAFYEAANDSDPLRRVFVEHDAGYLYLKMELAEGAPGHPEVLLDTAPDQGNSVINSSQVATSDPADFLLNLQRGNSHLLVDAYYDIHSYLYGRMAEFTSPNPFLEQKDSGNFVPILYVLNRAMDNLETGETTPFEDYEAGALIEGNGNPQAPDFNSLADYAWSPDGRTLEVRIPWLLLNFRDPSRKEIMTDFIANQTIDQGRMVEDIGLAFTFNTGDGVQQTLPAQPEGTQIIPPMKRYTWENWEHFETESRLKQSYYELQGCFGRQE
ncbi:hypothetical protein NQ024_08975 [Corynebacterium sp. 35RC1]|nr:hypothetical protein [Corynebacterium sp. 35RC1]